MNISRETIREICKNEGMGPLPDTDETVDRISAMVNNPEYQDLAIAVFLDLRLCGEASHKMDLLFTYDESFGPNDSPIRWAAWGLMQDVIKTGDKRANILSQAAKEAYEQLSEFRGYKVEPGHPISRQITDKMVKILDGILDVPIKQMQTKFEDGSGYWWLSVGEEGKEMRVDPCWTSLLPPERQAEAPWMLMIKPNGKASGINGESVSIWDLYEYSSEVGITLPGLAPEMAVTA